MKTIYLFRHGAVDDAFKTKIRGAGTDCDLSDLGRQMSDQNAAWLARQGIQCVVTSGMKRADYVGRVLGGFGVPHHVDKRLEELHFGEWEGWELHEVQRANPEQTRLFLSDIDAFQAPGGETIPAFRQRLRAAWLDLLNRDEDRIGVVAHGLSNSLLLQGILGRPVMTDNQLIACLNEIHVHEDGVNLHREGDIVYDRALFDAYDGH